MAATAVAGAYEGGAAKPRRKASGGRRLVDLDGSQFGEIGFRRRLQVAVGW